jgi:hypothetical protein
MGYGGECVFADDVRQVNGPFFRKSGRKIPLILTELTSYGKWLEAQPAIA